MNNKSKYMMFEPLPWQVDALEKLKNVDSKIKLIQKIGGGGKTYLSYLYFLNTFNKNDSVLVVAKLKELDEWKKVFGKYDFNVTYVSKGIFIQEDYIHKLKAYSLAIVDEADFGLSSDGSNTFKNIKRLTELCKETLLVSASLVDGDYVASIPILSLFGYTKDYLKGYFKVSPGYIKYTIKITSGTDAQRKSYRDLFDQYGFLEYEDLYAEEGIFGEKEATFNTNGYITNDIVRYKHTVTVNLDKPYKEMYKNYAKENFNVVTDWPLSEDEMNAKYATLKRMASGYYKYNDDLYLDWGRIIKLNELLSKLTSKTMIFYETHGDLYLLEQFFGSRFSDKVQFFSQKSPIEPKQFLVGQYSSMSRGIDIKDLRNIIFFSPTDKWKDLKQARYRVKRSMSYWNAVNEFYFNTPGTLQPKMWRRLMSNKNSSSKFY